MANLLKRRDKHFQTSRKCKVCRKGSMRISKRSSQPGKPARRLWVCCNSKCRAERLH